MAFGNMMNVPLLISSILTHAVENNPGQRIVTALDDGGMHEYTYADFDERVRRLASAMIRRSVNQGDRIGTIAWNTYRHLELYYAISGIGAVCHTVNPRLSPDQIAFIINHAGDTVVFFDVHFIEMARTLRERCPNVRRWVLLEERAEAKSGEEGFEAYSDWLGIIEPDFSWPQFDEQTASGLCYTSGTTGDPKGALYSNRSTVLHAYGSCHPDALAISVHDTVMPLVPMFHVNAWGLPYSALLSGAKIALPGANLRGDAVHRLCESAGVTLTAGVPTVFQGLLDHLASSGGSLASLKRVVIGGSACSAHMMGLFQKFGVTVLHAWGMTEVSPLGTVCRLLPKHAALPPEERRAILTSQGRPLFGVQFKIVNDHGKTIPRSGASGHLRIRGNWVIDRYYGQDRPATIDGWFDTGDVATLEDDGYMRITDRTKDVIKSGGEWISSIDLENIAMEHPAVQIAACVAIPHAKWGERPLIVVVPKEGAKPVPDEILSSYEGRVSRYAKPEQIIFIDKMPMTATGKIQKAELRKLPEVTAFCA